MACTESYTDLEVTFTGPLFSEEHSRAPVLLQDAFCALFSCGYAELGAPETQCVHIHIYSSNSHELNCVPSILLYTGET